MTSGARENDDRREASKLLVDVAKVAVALGSGAIAVNGAFLKDQSPGDFAFWFFLGSIVLFIVSVTLALTAITQTIRRAGGEIGGPVAWNFSAEKGLLDKTSIFGVLGIITFVLGTIVGGSGAGTSSRQPVGTADCTTTDHDLRYRAPGAADRGGSRRRRTADEDDRRPPSSRDTLPGRRSQRDFNTC